MFSHTNSYLFIACIVIACFVPFFKYFSHRCADLFDPVYWASAYFLLLFAIRPIYDLTLGSEILGSTPFDQDTLQAFNLGLLYALLGFLAFLTGYYSKANIWLASKLPNLPSHWDSQRLNMAWPTLLGLGIISHFLLVRSFGGWDQYICNKQHTLTAPGQGYLLLGVSLLSIAYTFTLTHSLSTGKRIYIIHALWLPLLLGIGFFSGSKGAFLMPILIAIVATHYLSKRIRFLHILWLFLIAFLSFPIFNNYREHSCTATDAAKKAPASITAESQHPVESLARHAMSRFYGIDSLTVIVRDTPEVMEFQHGKTILPLVVAWIPRQIWEEKPTISFGKVFAEKYMGKLFSNTGISASPTTLGEAYLNWHLPGLILIGLFSGMIVRSAYLWLIQRNFGSPAVFIYSQIFLFLFMFWEASIAGMVAERTASFIILMLVVFTVGRRLRIHGCATSSKGIN